MGAGAAAAAPGRRWDKDKDCAPRPIIHACFLQRTSPWPLPSIPVPLPMASSWRLRLFPLTAVSGMIGAVAGRLAASSTGRAWSRPGPQEADFVASAYRELAQLRTRGRLANGCIALLTLCAFLIGLTIILLFLGRPPAFQANRMAVAGFLAGWCRSAGAGVLLDGNRDCHAPAQFPAVERRRCPMKSASRTGGWCIPPMRAACARTAASPWPNAPAARPGRVRPVMARPASAAKQGTRGQDRDGGARIVPG